MADGDETAFPFELGNMSSPQHKNASHLATRTPLVVCRVFDATSGIVNHHNATRITTMRQPRESGDTASAGTVVASSVRGRDRGVSSKSHDRLPATRLPVPRRPNRGWALDIRHVRVADLATNSAVLPFHVTRRQVAFT
jgi:hypothetical protein